MANPFRKKRVVRSGKTVYPRTCRDHRSEAARNESRHKSVMFFTNII